jgi:hypothetical protein
MKTNPVSNRRTALFAVRPLMLCALSCKKYSVCTSLLVKTASQSDCLRVLPNSRWSSSQVSSKVCTSIKNEHLPSAVLCTIVTLARATIESKLLVARIVETRLSLFATDKTCTGGANRWHALSATCASCSQLSSHSHRCFGFPILADLESNRPRDTGLTPVLKRARAGESEPMDTELVFQGQQDRIVGEPLNLTKSFDQAAAEPGGAQVVQKQESGGRGASASESAPCGGRSATPSRWGGDSGAKPAPSQGWAAAVSRGGPDSSASLGGGVQQQQSPVQGGPQQGLIGGALQAMEELTMSPETAAFHRELAARSAELAARTAEFQERIRRKQALGNSTSTVCTAGAPLVESSSSLPIPSVLAATVASRSQVLPKRRAFKLSHTVAGCPPVAEQFLSRQLGKPVPPQPSASLASPESSQQTSTPTSLSAPLPSQPTTTREPSVFLSALRASQS